VGGGLGQIADLSESTGTVLACLNFSEQHQLADNRCVGPGLTGKHYYQLAFNDDGASGLEWYQNKYAPKLSIEQLIALAEKVSPGCDGLTARRLANSYSDLDGFENKTKQHTPGHFVRAMMESTATSLAQLVDDLCAKEKPSRIVATGGGAKSDLWLRIKADILGLEFVTTNCPEPACRGAAMLASQACGWFDSSKHAANAWVSIAKDFPPPKAI
jgi:sugar (pentulose or hexulose) kinase